jgi:anti-sigma-K factor RskA
VKLLRRDLHYLAGAYALDALDRSERDRFEHHLHRCPSCSNEVRGLREASTRLAFAASRVPPRAMRERVLTRATRIRQLPPATEGRRRRPEPRSSSLLRPAFVIGVVGLVAVIALGTLLVTTRHRLSTATAEQQAITSVLTAPDARLVTKRTSIGGHTTVVLSRRLRKAVVTTARLPSQPDNKVYQLWLIHLKPKATYRSAGLLPSPSAGKTAPVLATGLIRGDVLGVTVEPAGGTKQPTTTPIVLIPLYSKK